MREFVKLLISSSEKAANIARIIRNDDKLFRLLVEEKQVGEKNVRFVQDFKTLGDVLIQESLRWEISKKYPEMANNIFGEENNTFTNGLGEVVTVRVESEVKETAQLLTKVMGGGGGDTPNLAALTLAEEIHRNVGNAGDEDESCKGLEEDIPEDGVISDYADVGIWIDPIDATNEYIKGSPLAPNSSTGQEDKVEKGGLPCVTVLIGAFHLHSGKPIVGVINQPFHTLSSDNKWSGRTFWGTSHPSCSKSSRNIPPKQSHRRPSLILSSSEDAALKAKLGKDFDLVTAPGAGYKLLAVILGLTDAYILSKDTTHFWDSCGPHSILHGLGGGIVNFHQLLALDQVEELPQISYSVDNEVAKRAHFANLGGIVAFRDIETLTLLRKCLK